jgi:hypothetical protein
MPTSVKVPLDCVYTILLTVRIREWRRARLVSQKWNRLAIQIAKQRSFTNNIRIDKLADSTLLNKLPSLRLRIGARADVKNVDVEPLRQLTNLQQIKLMGRGRGHSLLVSYLTSQVYSIIETLPVTSLYIQKCYIGDSTMISLRNITELVLRNVDMYNGDILGDVERMTQLRSLQVYPHFITPGCINWSGVTKLTRLETLRMSIPMYTSHLTTLSSLNQLRTLEYGIHLDGLNDADRSTADLVALLPNLHTFIFRYEGHSTAVIRLMSSTSLTTLDCRAARRLVLLSSESYSGLPNLPNLRNILF